MAAARLSLTPSTCAASASGQQLPEHAARGPQPEQYVSVTIHGDQDPPSITAGEGSEAALLGQDKKAAYAGGKPPEHSSSAEQASQRCKGEAAASGKAVPHAEPCAPIANPSKHARERLPVSDRTQLRLLQEMSLRASILPLCEAVFPTTFAASSTGRAALHACATFAMRQGLTSKQATYLMTRVKCMSCKRICRPLPAPELGMGWTRVKHVRPSGRPEWIFHAPGGRSFRSKKSISSTLFDL